MKQTDRVPHKARGAAQSAGVPAERAGVPAGPESSGSNTVTSNPARAARNAIVRPITEPPMMATFRAAANAISSQYC